MGLERHIMDVIERDATHLVDEIIFSNGLRVFDEFMAKEAMLVLDASGEFGKTSFEAGTNKISFGIHPMFQ